MLYFLPEQNWFGTFVTNFLFKFTVIGVESYKHVHSVDSDDLEAAKNTAF